MRVLYFIQTFKGIPQIDRLVRTIKRSSPQSIVVISHNVEASSIDPTMFQDLADVHIIYASNIARGDFSILRAYLEGINWILDRGIHFDWVINMTGQCYPTEPLGQFENMLSSSSYDGFMNFFDAFTPSDDNPWDLDETSGRYNYQYHWRVTTKDLAPGLRKSLSIPRRVINVVQPFVRVDTSYGFQIGLRSKAQLFTEDFKLFGGSFFKTLSRDCVLYLNTFLKQRPDIKTYFENACLPEEALPQTILINSGKFAFCNDSRYYIEWKGGRLGRPRTLYTKDFDTIVNKGVSFARKFDLAEDSQILDLLDARIF